MKNLGPKTTQAKGFTLIELLTVMVIIGLLAGILIPSFARARFSAGLSACQGNLKGIGTATRLYANDSAQQFPSSLTVLTQPNSSGRPYMGSMPSCPSNSASYSGCYTTDTVSLFTAYCPGIHYKVMTGVSQGYPQFQTVNIVTQ